jgi:hypothetical protein
VPGRRLEHAHGAQWWKLEPHFVLRERRRLRQPRTKTRDLSQRRFLHLPAPGALRSRAGSPERFSSRRKIFSFAEKDMPDQFIGNIRTDVDHGSSANRS